MAEKNEILTLLTSQNPAGLAQLTEEFHPADILEVVQDQKDYSLLQALPDSFIADILDEAEDEDKYEILKSFNRERTHSILNQMSVDEVTDLIEALEEDNREAVIAALASRCMLQNTSSILRSPPKGTWLQIFFRLFFKYSSEWCVCKEKALARRRKSAGQRKGRLERGRGQITASFFSYEGHKKTS